MSRRWHRPAPMNGAGVPGPTKMSRSEANPEARRGAGSARPPPLWAAVVTAALLATGFRPRQFSPAPADVSRHSAAILDKESGRLADTPSEIPARGLKDILLRVYQNISDHRVVALAAGVTFYSLLAIFPAIAALVAIYGLF